MDLKDEIVHCETVCEIVKRANWPSPCMEEEINIIKQVL